MNTMVTTNPGHVLEVRSEERLRELEKRFALLQQRVQNLETERERSRRETGAWGGKPWEVK